MGNEACIRLVWGCIHAWGAPIDQPGRKVMSHESPQQCLTEDCKSESLGQARSKCWQTHRYVQLINIMGFFKLKARVLIGLDCSLVYNICLPYRSLVLVYLPSPRIAAVPILV